MIYSSSITVPANTPATDPLRIPLKVTKGLVYRLEVEFPPGPWGLLYMAVFDGSFQVWPTTPGEFFHSDHYCVAFDDTYLKETAPYTFDIIAYNLDDTYQHKAQVRIGLVSEKVFMARFLPSLSYEFFKEMLIELQKSQEAEKQAQLENVFPWVR